MKDEAIKLYFDSFPFPLSKELYGLYTVNNSDSGLIKYSFSNDAQSQFRAIITKLYPKFEFMDGF
jgi:hypothetical protein